MKIAEVKIRLINTANSLIDTYFNGSDFSDKFLNSTMKIIIKQNANKFDDVFKLFADKNDDIDLDMMVNEYSKMISDNGIIFDIKDYVSNDFVKNMLPDKVLVIKKEDILSLVS
jgi:hypothetical protein